MARLNQDFSCVQSSIELQPLNQLSKQPNRSGNDIAMFSFTNFLELLGDITSHPRKDSMFRRVNFLGWYPKNFRDAPEILGIPPVSSSAIYFFVRLRRFTFLPVTTFLYERLVLVFLILLTSFSQKCGWSRFGINHAVHTFSRITIRTHWRWPNSLLCF